MMAGISSACPNADYAKPVIDADLETEFRIECLTEDDCRDLAAGIVPSSVRVSALALLDFEDFLRRNAEKPVRRRKQAKG